MHVRRSTTYTKKLAGLRDDILTQKRATKSFCSGARIGPILAAATGTITVYEHVSRQRRTHIYLVDPPVESATGNADFDAELTAVLRYYANFYTVTHVRPQNEELIGLAAWLLDIVEDIEEGQPPPEHPPRNKRLVPRGRVREPNQVPSEYEGTILDARISQASIRKYPTFEKATRSIPEPVTFIGVSQHVTLLITECRWSDLLKFHDENARHTSEHREILDSGIVIRNAGLSDAEERESSRIFSKEKERLTR